MIGAVVVRSIELPPGQFTFGQIQRLSGLTESQLINLTNKRVIVPRVEDPEGTGYVRVFDLANLVQARIIAQLMPLRIPVPVLTRLVAAMTLHITVACGYSSNRPMKPVYLNIRDPWPANGPISCSGHDSLAECGTGLIFNLEGTIRRALLDSHKDFLHQG